jgi:hypothetical protein
MAAIIGLLRMGETDQKELLAGIDLVLSKLLYLWQSRDVPLLIELASTEEDRLVLELFLAGDDIARPIIAAPHVPDDRVAALRAAFDATMADAAFLDDAARGKMEIAPSSGLEIQAIATRVLNAPAAVIAKAKASLEVRDIIKELPAGGKASE